MFLSINIISYVIENCDLSNKCNITYYYIEINSNKQYNRRSNLESSTNEVCPPLSYTVYTPVEVACMHRKIK